MRCRLFRTSTRAAPPVGFALIFTLLVGTACSAPVDTASDGTAVDDADTGGGELDGTADADAGTPDGTDDTGPVKPVGCYACHGTLGNGNPAPPTGTNAETATTELAVGAHQQHLADSVWHRTVQCDDCHKVPLSIKHSNGVVDYAWSAVATAMASTPTFDPGTATCSGAYCHGGALPDVSAVMFIASRIGTPALIRVPSVLVQRATTVL